MHGKYPTLLYNSHKVYQYRLTLLLQTIEPTIVSWGFYPNAKTVMLDNIVNTHISNNRLPFIGIFRYCTKNEFCSADTGSLVPYNIGTVKWV